MKKPMRLRSPARVERGHDLEAADIAGRVGVSCDESRGRGQDLFKDGHDDAA